jgi:hypothetical protein
MALGLISTRRRELRATRLGDIYPGALPEEIVDE